MNAIVSGSRRLCRLWCGDLAFETTRDGLLLLLAVSFESLLDLKMSLLSEGRGVNGEERGESESEEVRYRVRFLCEI